MMNIDMKQMNSCLQLAKKGIGKVSPNPLVGCVIVKDGNVIGQGFHEFYGGPHAEVNAINSVEDPLLLEGSTLYVNLEPCSHHGKTPPCTDLIIQHKIAKVVIGTKDQFFRVNGSGIEKLKEAGIDVLVNVLEEKSLELNKRFFTFHSEKRPYVILKWAQTSDGFIDIDRKEPLNIDSWITDLDAKVLVHHWRAEEQAIMVGTNTALNDNPKLTVREVDGNNPTRIVLDMSLRLPDNLNLFDGSVPTLVFNSVKNEVSNNLELIKIDAKGDIMDQILDELYYREIQSMIIEGGGQLINTFIYQNLWDEARVFTGNKEFKKGLPAPTIKKNPIFTLQIETDILNTYMNG
ncbi:MAG: bifunctional diaminohydroxyphosphoribosylaminopyrimidine deaminase/5-amino-6-(5-phosphoribosylamino)uracil reductase RibD [Vicingaceae bacterium]